MNSLDPSCFNPQIHHIYIEETVMQHPRTLQILDRFPDAGIIKIRHYKDIFGRVRQDFTLQQRSRALIIAARSGPLLYPGAPVCQDFGEEYFYYTSCMMNCMYDCEYCYLKGMYPSGYPVIFVNLEDYFEETEALLASHPVYLCISYDTDLLAAEGLTGYVREWVDFAASHPDLTIEIRTKSANLSIWETLPALPGVIYAFTLSPQPVTEEFEHGTPSLQKRLRSAAAAMQNGHPVRLCFDPIIYLPDWRRYYQEMAAQVQTQIDLRKIRDISIGSFRISQDYLKKMRRAMPASRVVQFPFINENGYYSYGKELSGEMENYVIDLFSGKIPSEKMFRWR